MGGLQGSRGHLMSEKPNFLSPSSIPGLGCSPVDLGLWAALIPLVCCRCGKDAGV